MALISGSQTITTANLTDLLDGGASTLHSHAGTAAAFDRVHRVSSALTTTSTSLVDVTGATITITTGAFPLAYSFAQNVRIGAAGRITFNVYVDDVAQHGSAGLGQWMNNADTTYNTSFSSQTDALSAAQHVIKVKWKTSTSTARLDADSAAAYIWAVHEIR